MLLLRVRVARRGQMQRTAAERFDKERLKGRKILVLSRPTRRSTLASRACSRISGACTQLGLPRLLSDHRGPVGPLVV